MDVQLPEDLGRVQQMGVVDNLLDIPGDEWQVQNQWQPVSVDQEEERQEGVDGGFRNNVGVETIAKVDGVDIVTGVKRISMYVLHMDETWRQPGSSWSRPLEAETAAGSGLLRHVPFQIAVHDSEEDLQEQVHGVYKHRE